MATIENSTPSDTTACKHDRRRCNPLIEGDSAVQTANNVAAVLKYITHPEREAVAMCDDDTYARGLIMVACIDALEVIGNPGRS